MALPGVSPGDDIPGQVTSDSGIAAAPSPTLTDAQPQPRGHERVSRLCPPPPFPTPEWDLLLVSRAQNWQWNCGHRRWNGVQTVSAASHRQRTAGAMVVQASLGVVRSDCFGRMSIVPEAEPRQGDPNGCQYQEEYYSKHGN
jgi:hypothetical protein